MRRYGYPVALLLACAASACSSVHPEARVYPVAQNYWIDPFWQERLLYAVQSAVHQPTDTDKTLITGVNGMVRFTVSNGAIENPQIVASTGYANLDMLMLQQVASVKPPETSGPHAHEPHEFELLLDMLTPFDSFEYNVYRAIDYQKAYPKNEIIADTAGNNTVDFDYLDGKASNITLTASSRSNYLDEASLDAVTRAILPPAPTAYVGKPIHMEVILCYTLFESPSGVIVNQCPIEKNVIVVQGTRIKRTTVVRGFGGLR